MNAERDDEVQAPGCDADDVRSSRAQVGHVRAASAAPYALPARSMGTRTRERPQSLARAVEPELPHSARRLPRGVTVNVMMTSAVIGAKALSSTLMPAWGKAMAMPMASEKAMHEICRDLAKWS